MTPEQKQIVRETWERVVPIGHTAAELFYHRLFEIDPTVRALFRSTNMSAQRRKLVDALTFAVRALDDLDGLLPTVASLGRRHAGYGVTEADYDSVGATLLWTLERDLGRSWTPAAAWAWTELYALLAGTMRRAAREASTGAALAPRMPEPA